MTASILRPENGQVVPEPSFLMFANGSMIDHDMWQPKVTRFTRQKNGTTQQVALYEGVPIFRSGVFADSRGEEKEWLSEQMSTMVDNFNYLKSSGIFADVPVRAGHPSFLGGNPLRDVIGYFTSLRSEEREAPIRGQRGEKFTYILADYEILDPEADEKIASGLWKNRSSEIGTYFTNSPTKELYPTIMGVAYVDIPAVEGLNGFAKQHSTEHFSILTEVPVTTPVTTATTSTGSGDGLPKPKLTEFGSSVHEFSIGGVTTTDPARVQTYITSLESNVEQYRSQVKTLESENTTLKDFKENVVKAGRKTRIEMLGKSVDGKPATLTAPQVTSSLEFAAGLSEEQFEQYMKTLEAAPPATILQNHGVQNGEAGHRPAEQPKDGPDEVKDLTETLSVMKNYSKMSDEQLQATSAYQKLKALKPEFTLTTL